MFKKTALRAAACLALAATASAAQSATVYSLANDGATLIRFDSATPGAVTTVGAISGAATNLNGLDFRPANGLLYGYQQSSSGIYVVNTATGATSLVSTSALPVGSSQLGIDFNPTVDRLRLVTAADENRRLNVDTGASTPPGGDTALAYAGTDTNAGADPNVVDVAYTFSDRNPGTATTLYYIDVALDILATTSNPNGGVLNTVGSLGFNTDRFTGFDILTDAGGVNSAFATLRVGGIEGFYSINLTTGAATPLGAVGAQNLYGLAIAQPLAVIPEPASLALVALAGLAAFGVRRRSAAPARGAVAA